MSSRTAFRRTTASHPGQVTGSRRGPRDVPSLAPLVWGPHIPYDVPDAMISRPGAMNFRVLRDRVWRAGQRRAPAGGRPAGHRGTRSRATRPAASGRYETQLDMPADLA